MTRLRLTIDVKYEAGDVEDADLARLLLEIATEAFADGRFTSDLDACVTSAEAFVFVHAGGTAWVSISVPALMVSEGENE